MSLDEGRQLKKGRLLVEVENKVGSSVGCFDRFWWIPGSFPGRSLLGSAVFSITSWVSTISFTFVCSFTATGGSDFADSPIPVVIVDTAHLGLEVDFGVSGYFAMRWVVVTGGAAPRRGAGKTGGTACLAFSVLLSPS